jgi:hypothetical protein
LVPVGKGSDDLPMMRSCSSVTCTPAGAREMKLQTAAPPGQSQRGTHQRPRRFPDAIGPMATRYPLFSSDKADRPEADLLVYSYASSTGWFAANVVEIFGGCSGNAITVIGLCLGRSSPKSQVNCHVHGSHCHRPASSIAITLRFRYQQACASQTETATGDDDLQDS